MNAPVPAKQEPKQDKVRRRLLSGQSYDQIAKEIGITRGAVKHHVCNLRKASTTRPGTATGRSAVTS